MITLKGVTLRRGTKVLLEGATVALNPGEKIGLVGRNGAGKSSLFALLSGALLSGKAAAAGAAGCPLGADGAASAVGETARTAVPAGTTTGRQP